VRFSLFWRLALILFLFYTTLRGEFLWWNRNLFSDENFSDLASAFWVGLPFDAVAIAWTLLPVVIWGWLVRQAYWIPFFAIQIPLWVINVIDIEMWKFWGRRMTFSSLDILKEGEGKTAGIAGDYVGWIGLAIVIGFVFWFSAAAVLKNQRHNPFKWKSVPAVGEQFLILALIVIGMRGGFQRKPLTLVNADHFVKSQMNQLSLDTSFSLLKSAGKRSLERTHYFANKEEALALVNGGVKSEPVLPPNQFAQKQNVVILILESFSWEYTGLNPNGKSYTPFLDGLMKRSLTFPRAMANGRRSIEGVAAILSGIPALMEEPFITSEFSTNQFVGVGQVFAHEGYDTSFYHGGGNGTMHFDAFTRKAGIENYFGSNQYPDQKDNDGIWGIFDRPYLKYYANELGKKPQPFFSALFTLSSHQPYKIPAGDPFENAQAPEPILKAIAYADSALEDFFKLAEKQPWYQNTLFVLSADHTGPLVQTSFDDKIGAYRIPILFFHPQIQEWPAGIEREKLAQQIDIPASLYDFLHFDHPKTVELSRSVFRPGPRTFTAYMPGIYIHTDGKTVLIEQPNLKNFVDFEHDKKSEASKPELEQSLKAVKEIFSEGLWDNALYF
jgi:phosphoglycerol transferase MdoB-like AlkP superfamily enzyme